MTTSLGRKLEKEFELLFVSEDRSDEYLRKNLPGMREAELIAFGDMVATILRHWKQRLEMVTEEAERRERQKGKAS